MTLHASGATPGARRSGPGGGTADGTAGDGAGEGPARDGVGEGPARDGAGDRAGDGASGATRGPDAEETGAEETGGHHGPVVRWFDPSGPAGALRPPAAGEPALWLVRVAEHAPYAAAVAGGVLDAAERGRAGAFVRAADRDRYRVAHLALRLLLGGYLDTEPRAVELVREPCPRCGGPHGRPAVSAGAPHFSLSHTGDLVLLAFADLPVGADVEEWPEERTVREVSAALHPGERAELAALPAGARRAAFARCWTRKEAHLKGTGAGLSGGLAATYTGTGPVPAPIPGWTLTDVPVPPGHAAACAVRREPPGAR
ncbi:4'-phosphopantetheinyl transferase family protein [Streptomyces zingiberis]|uniref:4'-phosphopantetheinyl transferase superfamily protein n=1 Tax=Streptomyces zingiberis TaxID=2053010 RepID=A0ABX1BYS8_9ACTN|nr:4'-phosphopantetheinyl transferase superfamily protein [Streptomyces zingiberis]NJQ02849.1 4'-phosphopantetheinyl transferase superfamily protein [Streptomyces zingiberis]